MCGSFWEVSGCISREYLKSTLQQDSTDTPEQKAQEIKTPNIIIITIIMACPFLHKMMKD